jgi:nucleoside 2-deoxyribosyltransferase
MITVYLAGLISTEKPESLEWRTQIQPVLESAGMRVLSPMRGKENLVRTSKDGGITDPTLTPKDVIFRDYRDVKEADVILAHLDTFGSERPLLGTIYELGWAWMLQKPVVAIASKDNRLMRNHPFVVDTISHYCETLEEARNILVRHYGR